EPFGHRRGDGEGLGGREARREDELAQVDALEELHRHERHVALAPHFVDRDDGGMADARGGARFLEEPRLVLVALLATRPAERDGLDRDHASQRRVLRAVDDAHRAAPQLAHHAEAAELRGHGVGHHEPPKRRRRSRQNPPLDSGFPPPNVCVTGSRSPGLSSSLRSKGAKPGLRIVSTCRPAGISSSLSGGVRPREIPSTKTSPLGLIASVSTAGRIERNAWWARRAEMPRKRIAATPSTARRNALRRKAPRFAGSAA